MRLLKNVKELLANLVLHIGMKVLKNVSLAQLKLLNLINKEIFVNTLNVKLEENGILIY